MSAVHLETSLLSESAEGKLFRRLRFQTTRAMIRDVVHAAGFRSSVLVLLSAVFWIGMFFVFAEGFRFLNTMLTVEHMREQIVDAIFNAFFLTLMIMIAISSAIIMYGRLYHDDETDFLLSTPTRPERIVMYRFHEAVYFSTWGFFLLGSPLLIAYGVTADSPWLFYLLLGPLVASFALIPTSIGSLACLFIVYVTPRLRKVLLVVAIVVGVVGVFFLLWGALKTEGQDLITPMWLQSAVGRLRYAENRFLPSWWFTRALLLSAVPSTDENHWTWRSECFMLLGALWFNALVLVWLLQRFGAALYRESFSRVNGMLGKRHVRVGFGMDPFFAAICAPLPRPFRSLILKDLLTFRRDPVMWTQIAVFLGLLLMYVANLRRFDYGSQLDLWIVVVGYMNIAVIALIYSTFATRFILPLISLEGRSFWVIGSSPAARYQVIWSKFLLAIFMSAPTCVLLVLASDYAMKMFGRNPLIVVSHILTMASLCFGLSGLAVGYGARFPNLRENNPSRIAAGIGGTLNLVASTIYILFVTALVAIPGYLLVAIPIQEDANTHSGTLMVIGNALRHPAALLSALALAVALSLSVCIWSIRVGIRAFDQLEN